ncbi:MAG: hypothetical protein HOC20_05645 [Chloroflexi bacterium]|nr:hypothetical protein [Chloroflexota bacterium]
MTAPSVRELYHNHCKEETPSDDRGVAWSEGDEITLKLVVAVFEAPQLQGLFDRFCDLRKCSLYTSEPRCKLPYSAGWKIIEEKYNRDNWVEADGYYKLAPNFHTTFETASEPLCFLWQIGWVGGGIMSLPMLAKGNAETRARAMRNLGMIFDKTQAPSGFFMGLGDGKKFYSDGVDVPHNHNLHMVRKSGDWLYFGIKQLDLLQKQGVEVPESWNNALKKLADAFVRLWEQSGQFGQWVDVETGKLLIGGSASGGIVPGALVLASEFFNDNTYLQVAEASARKYYNEFALKGITTGGPGEILSAPDSEAAFALVESFVALLEKTGAPEWAQAAKDMVRQAATWVVSYDYTFPADSSLGLDDARSTGAVWANIQNKHGAPGICTFSGDSLFRLWRLTGDEVALDLIKDIAHGIPQYLSLADRPLSSHMQPGWMCERVNLSDWEGPDGVGGSLFGSSSWPETAFMLTTLEIPGIYVQTDTGHVTVFDNIELESVEHEGSKITLNLYNPTSFDAEVKVLVESARNAKDALTLNANQSWQVVSIPKGARVQLNSDSLNMIAEKKENNMITKKTKNILMATAVALACISPLAAKESKEDFGARMQWFEEAKFGLFIHWGSYSTLAGSWKGKQIDGYAEWIQAGADIPKAEYSEVAKRFNPSKFNAEEWIKTAKQAGMKYMVITTKHHDGFCLWDSKYTEYDIKDAAGVEKDLLGELSAACKKYGIKFGTYYSIIDWHHPTQKPASGDFWTKWGNPDWAGPNAKEEYVQYMKNQLKELVDRYDTQIFWFDGDWWKNWSMADGEDLYAYLREIQPTAIINNRVSKRNSSKIDFGTPEQFTPGTKLDYYWEACWTINHSWGYKEHDKNWKTTKQLVQKLVDINSKGGALLLNIGPTTEGEFPPGCLDRLAGMGDWLKTHSEAIYKTKFADIPLQDWGRVLQKGDTIYLHVFDWPADGKLTVAGLNADVQEVMLMNSEEKVSAENKGKSLLIRIPAKGSNEYSSVIKLVAAPGAIKTFELPDASLPLKEGDLVLSATKAEITGSGALKYEGENKNLGWWTSEDNVATWKQEVVIPGKFEVIFVYASKEGGSQFVLEAAEQSLTGTVKGTGGWEKYQELSAGVLTLPEITNYTFSLKMTEKKSEALFNLKAVILRPIHK